MWTTAALHRIDTETEVKSGILNLTDCDLTGIPEKILNMSWLQELSLKSNQISAIKNLDALPSLQYLDLDRNQIVEIKNLDALARLKTLFLSRNQIIEINGGHNIKHG